MKKMILFCIPYAGGSAMIYQRWRKELDSYIEVYPLELTGRGTRFNEPFYQSIDEAVNDLYKYIESAISDKTELEYALFGHSMGSLLAFELFHKIAESGMRKPVHMFFSGGAAPQLLPLDKETYKLPKDEFIKEILVLGGTPQEVFEDKNLIDLFLPILRADYTIIGNYNYKPKPIKIDCCTTILYGKEDKGIKISNINEWNNQMLTNCNFYQFEGGHFFINDKVKEITQILNKTLYNSSHSYTC